MNDNFKIVTKSCLLGDLEDEVCDLDVLCSFEEFNNESDFRSVASNWYAYIPDLDLFVREGLILEFDEKEGEYYADFAVTFILSNNELNGEYLYFEQGCILTSLANYLNSTSDKYYRISDIEKMECYFYIPEEDLDY